MHATMYACLTGAVALVVAAPPVDAPSIHVGENVRVTREWPERPLIEPHLAVDPRDPNHLLGVVIVASTSRIGASTCGLFESRDGGLTWRTRDLNIRDCTDPWVAITADGHA